VDGCGARATITGGRVVCWEGARPAERFALFFPPLVSDRQGYFLEWKPLRVRSFTIIDRENLTVKISDVAAQLVYTTIPGQLS
jgi:hypothetical protein